MSKFNVGDWVFINKDCNIISQQHRYLYLKYDWIPFKVEKVCYDIFQNKATYRLRKLNLESRNIGEIILGEEGKAGEWLEEALCTSREYSKNHRPRKCQNLK